MEKDPRVMQIDTERYSEILWRFSKIRERYRKIRKTIPKSYRDTNSRRSSEILRDS
jgi:hypothetical protein